ncbi:acyltransferase-domain-containing protein [Crepidotus variabilis]|uniref:Acyltransferase-domain-containing protein n=1 Tax=Crepidotus variabilis TaxID=179855 RepID=A0A9P6EVN3_9AGAR|nr:acyltransferase-domain-containing protein [Crepidotus variabilis]
MSSSNLKLCSTPIHKRPSISGERKIYAILFAIVFNLGCLLINGSQFVFLLPLRLLPLPWARDLYYAGIRYTKGAFGCLTILMCQWFAPTKLLVTFQTEGTGAFTQEELERYTIKDHNGKLVALDLPTKFVLIANHQIYADWWYAWCFTYFMSPQSIHRYVYITLKKSLRWVPIVGWGMQFFEFIFLARSWASDRQQLAISLASLGKQAADEDSPLCFILYPEGTLVSKDTKPKSKKYADKMGIADMNNILLPRSTGLHYSLRSLVPKIPELRLLDMTVAYPGIPRLGYGQDYYTLRSIFFDGIPPPAIHIHLRIFDVKKDVPIGDMTSASSAKTPDPDAKHVVEVDIPDKEKETFDVWLRNLWKDKDGDVDRYLENNSFASNDRPAPSIDIPLELRSNMEILEAFCFFWPAGLIYLWGKIGG